MVVVAVVVMVVVAVVVVTVVVVVVRVSATHLQHDKVEGFDARGFEFEHVLAFLKTIDVNHGVGGARRGTVDGLLGLGVFVTFVVVMLLMLVLVMVRLGDEGVVEVRGSPSDVLGLVQHHVINTNLADVPLVACLIPHVQGPVPRGVGFDTADAGDHVTPRAERGVQGDVVVAKGAGGQVPTRPVFVRALVFEDDGRVVGVMDHDHVVVFFVLLVLFFLGGEVRRFVGAFVEVLAQVGDQDRFELKRDVTVGHGVGGHGLRC